MIANLRGEPRWEVGGDFHLMEFPPGPAYAMPKPWRRYALGRHALKDLIKHLRSGSARLWLPDYFCEEVTDYCSGAIEIRRYEDDPLRREPAWKTLVPKRDDLVVAVNYFGARSGSPWQRWRLRNSCCLIEDHSHDPAAAWARKSQADYAFASLRKTLPIPDGALLWSPRNLPLPQQRVNQRAAGAGKKLRAMKHKAAYLSGEGGETGKQTYRRLQRQGEAVFGSAPVSGISEFSGEKISQGIPQSWRMQRSLNVERLVTKLRGWKTGNFVFRKWPAASAPLAAVVLFRSEFIRDKCRAYLEKNKVYCPVHWPAPEECCRRVRDIAGRILTIPADQRYTCQDMDEIANLLLGFR